MGGGSVQRPVGSRRAFAASCLGTAALAASSVLGGCSFSLRDLLDSPARIGFGRDGGEPVDVEADSSRPEESRPSRDFPAAEGRRYGFWMDTEACVGCGSCISACRDASRTPEDGDARRRLVLYEMEGGKRRYVSLSCLHCAEPACVRVCPAGAVSKRADGIVVVDRGSCIGCRYCRQACPFDVPRYLDGTMDKCDCCLGADVAPGSRVRCATSCPTEALRYGEIDELRRLSEGRALLAEAPTGPSLLVS